jgi:hypothetical protein
VEEDAAALAGQLRRVVADVDLFESGSSTQCHDRSTWVYGSAEPAGGAAP